MITVFNGREVECEVSIASEPEDCFIESAVYTDTGEPLDSDELDLLQDAAGELLDEAYQDARQGAADAAYDRMKDEGCNND